MENNIKNIEAPNESSLTSQEEYLELYHEYVRQKIERGLKEMQEGKFVTEEEMEKIFDEWLVE